MSDTRNDIKSISISVTARTKDAVDKLTALNAILEQLKTTGKSISLPSKSITQFANALERMSTVNLNGLSRKLVAISNAFQKMNFKGIDVDALRAQAALMNAQAKKDNIAVQKAKIAQSKARLAVAQQNAATSAAKQQRLASQAAAQGSRTRTSTAGAANGNQAAQGDESWLKSWQQKWGLNSNFQVVSDLKKDAAAQKESEKNAKERQALIEESDKAMAAAIEQIMQMVQKSMAAIAKGFSYGIKYVSRFSALVGKTLLRSFTAAAKGAFKLTAAIGLGPWKRLGASIKSAVTGLNGFLSAVKRIAVYRAIRWALKQITQAFKEGIDNLYQYSLLIDGKFMHSMDMLATASLYVKNSMAAMVAPIINEVAPAIDYLADKFVDLLNTVNETVAAMTGAETWTKAIKYPTEYAEAADDANASAKKLRNTLLGFDEINRLDDKSKSKRGSSGSALDYSKMFEEKQVTKNAKSFVKTLKDAFKSGDLTSIGESLGKNLLDGLNKIPWEDIKRSVKRNAKSVATLINGFIDVPDLGYTLGKSIAAAFNTAVAKMNEFFSTIEWGKVGTFLADGINGAIENFNIDELAKGVATRINGIATMIKDFGHEVNWGNVASFLTNGITTAIDEINISDLTGAIAGVFKTAIDLIGNVAETVEWSKLGAWLADGVNSIFKKFNTDPPIAESIAHVFNAAVTSLGSYVSNVEWSEIGKFLGDNINAFLSTFSIKDLGKTIAGMINKGFAMIGSFIDEVEWSKVSTFLSDGINGFFNDLNAKEVGKTISKALVKALGTVKDFLKKTDFEAIGKKIGDLLASLDWTNILTGLVSVIASALGSAFDILKGVWEKSPAAAIVLGTAFANLLATAIGLPSVSSIVVNAITSLVGSGIAAGAAASAAGSAAAGAAGAAATSVATNSAIYGITTGAAGGAAAGGAAAGGAGALATGGLIALAAVLGGAAGYVAQDKIPAVRNAADALWEYLLGDIESTSNYLNTSLHESNGHTHSGGGGSTLTPEEQAKRSAELAEKRQQAAANLYTTYIGDAIKPLSTMNAGIKDKLDEVAKAQILTDELNRPLTALETAVRNNTAQEKNVNDWFSDKGNPIITNLANINTATTKQKEAFAAYKKKMEGSWIFKDGGSSVTLTTTTSGSNSNRTNVVLGRAKGGDVPTGSLFLAGEAGAEIVSSQGGKTTVHNRDQIAESVAIGSEEGNELLRQLVNVGNKILAKETSVVTQITTGDITTAMDRQNRREGRSVIPVALGG